MIVSNYCWGASCIAHSSASVMTSTSLGDVDYLVVYGEPGQPYTLAFPDPNSQVDQLSGSHHVTSSVSNGRTVMAFNISAGESTIIKVSGGKREVRVIILDTETAYLTWEVVVDAGGDHGNHHYLIGSNDTALVIGPYVLPNSSFPLILLQVFRAVCYGFRQHPASPRGFEYHHNSLHRRITIIHLLHLEQRIHQPDQDFYRPFIHLPSRTV